MRSTLAALATLFTLAAGSGAAEARDIPKGELDSAFAHIKHGQLFLTGRQGPQHSLGSHGGWAKGQQPRVVAKEIVFQIFESYRGLVTNRGLSKEDLDQGFAHIKQGQLILNGKTGPEHSLGSHLNWAKGQSKEAVVDAIDAEIVAIRDTVLAKL